MEDKVIEVEGLSKAYQLGQIGTGTISRDIERFVTTKILRKEDPFLKIGEVNKRDVKGESDIVWSLKDINFSVNKGEAIGIIGKNGAGKSTLLKLLSRVTSPTEGAIKLNGRVASLLEVGTGFHPELSGRENIFLNGAILGMRKSEIKRKFDEIVAFSGVGRYVDTPVKRYSSGMYVRLAFAVAAHLECEVLIVDEVLAVGDAEFQKKCIGKMREISSGEGRTILFVSHNMAAVKSLCTKGVLLEDGMVKETGDIDKIVSSYLSSNKDESLQMTYRKENLVGNDMELIEVIVSNDTGETDCVFEITDAINVNCKMVCKEVVPNAYLYVTVANEQEEVFIESDSFDCPPNFMNSFVVGENNFEFKIDKNILPIGVYKVYFNFTSKFANKFNIDSPGNVVCFEVVDTVTQRASKRSAHTSFLIDVKNKK